MADEAQKAFEESVNFRDPGQETSTEPAAAAPSPQPSGPPPELLARAAAVGIGADVAKGIPPESLTSILERLEWQPEPEQEPEPPRPQYKFDPMTGKPLEQPKAPVWEPIPLDPQVFTPELAAVWDKQQQQLAAFAQRQQDIIDRQQQELAGLKQTQISTQSQNDFRQLEEAIQADADLKEVLGEGPADRLVGTRAHNERVRVAVMVDSIRESYSKQGMVPPTIREAYQMARGALHSDRIQQSSQRREVERARSQDGRFISRPIATDRTDNLPPPGEERAVRVLEQKMRLSRN